MCPSPSKERSKSPARKYIRVESPAVVNPNKRSLGCEVRLGVVMVILAMDASTEYLFAMSVVRWTVMFCEVCIRSFIKCNACQSMRSISSFSVAAALCGFRLPSRCARISITLLLINKAVLMICFSSPAESWMPDRI